MRAQLLACLLAVGCYDTSGLTRAYGGGAGGGGGGSDGGLPYDASGPGAANWQLVTPPARVALRGVFGSDTAVFAVGASSQILRLTPMVAAETAPPGYNLRAVWSGGGGALAVGDSETVLTRGSSGWDGASLADATLYAITDVPGGGGAVAVGSGGAIVHQVGSAWNGEDSGVVGLVALRGVGARAAGDVVAVGEGGTILRGTGVAPLSWTTETRGANPDLFAVWASATDTWAVGAGGTILYSPSAGSWTAERNDTKVDLFGVFAAAGNAWAVGAGGTILVRHGGVWSLERSGGPDLRAVWGTPSGEAWAVGDDGTILHRTP